MNKKKIKKKVYDELNKLSQASKDIINALEYFEIDKTDKDCLYDLSVAHKLVNNVYDKLFESLL